MLREGVFGMLEIKEFIWEVMVSDWDSRVELKISGVGLRSFKARKVSVREVIQNQPLKKLRVDLVNSRSLEVPKYEGLVSSCSFKIEIFFSTEFLIDSTFSVSLDFKYANEVKWISP